MNECVSCDWFAFSVSLPLTEREKQEGAAIRCPDGFSMFEYGGTNLYRRRLMLFDEFGQKCLTLLLEPYSPIIKYNNMFVEVANRLLYEGFSNTLSLLAEIHEFSWCSLSRLDVACDFNPTINQYAVMDGLRDGTIYVTGKREGSQFFDINVATQQVERNVKQFNWGAKQSNLRWKLYNKTLELTDFDKATKKSICTKPYIHDTWLANKIDPSNVWRLELSIVNASSYTWRGEKLDWSMNDVTNYTPFFWDLYALRFKCRRNEGHKNKGKDTLVPFLDIPTADHYRLRTKEPQGNQPYTDHAVTLRAAMKEVLREEVRCYRPMAEAWLSVCQKTIEAANLQSFFLNQYGVTFEQFKQQYNNL